MASVESGSRIITTKIDYNSFFDLCQDRLKHLQTADALSRNCTHTLKVLREKGLSDLSSTKPVMFPDSSPQKA